MGPFLGERLVDDPPGRGVHPRVGDTIQPAAKLRVQVLQIAEGTGEEEVLADVTERPLDLSLGLGPIGLAGPRMEAIVASQVDQGPIVDDAVRVALAEHRRLHAVVEQFARCAAEGLERRHMAAQHRRQVLVHHEPCPDQPAVAQHHGEQPHDPRRGRLVGEHHLEPGEVDLALLARCGLEAHLEPRIGRRPHLPQEVRDRRIAARVPELLQLPQQPGSRQGGIGAHPLAQGPFGSSGGFGTGLAGSSRRCG